MTDELTSDSKEDQPIRQNLVDTAVSFLLNQNVKQRPDDAKIAFLKKKGLTESEIVEAFNRVKYDAGSPAFSNEDQQFINAYPLPPHPYQMPFWFHLRSYSSTFVSFAVAVYVLHRFYKSYIEPWLFGSNSEKSELSALKQQLTELNNSVSRLNSTVASLEEAVNNQVQQLDRSAVYNVEFVPKSVRDILEEVSNVKGLLLNRFSFPAPPSIAGTTVENKTQHGDPKAPSKVVTIPKWQLRDSELGKSKVDPKGEVEESDNKENSSSESVSLENSLSSEEDQKNNVKIAKDKVQDENSNTVLEDKNEILKACEENYLSLKDNTLDEDLEPAVQNQVKNMEEKTLDEDSGVESHNYLSDSESTDRTSGHHESIKNLE